MEEVKDTELTNKTKKLNKKITNDEKNVEMICVIYYIFVDLKIKILFFEFLYFTNLQNPFFLIFRFI